MMGIQVLVEEETNEKVSTIRKMGEAHERECSGEGGRESTHRSYRTSSTRALIMRQASSITVRVASGVS